MRFYAMKNLYGSETSHGFSNTREVWVFSTQASRDAWVEVEGKTDITIRPILRREVMYNANTGENAPKPFSGEYWGIDPYPTSPEEPVEGFIGRICCCDPLDNYERFYR